MTARPPPPTLPHHHQLLGASFHVEQQPAQHKRVADLLQHRPTGQIAPIPRILVATTADPRPAPSGSGHGWCSLAPTVELAGTTTISWTTSVGAAPIASIRN